MDKLNEFLIKQLAWIISINIHQLVKNNLFRSESCNFLLATFYVYSNSMILS